MGADTGKFGLIWIVKQYVDLLPSTQAPQKWCTRHANVCETIQDAKDQANKRSETVFGSSWDADGGVANAFRHAYWNGTSVRLLMREDDWAWDKAARNVRIFMGKFEKEQLNGCYAANRNNKVGRNQIKDCVERNGSSGWVTRCILTELARGNLRRILHRPTPAAPDRVELRQTLEQNLPDWCDDHDCRAE